MSDRHFALEGKPAPYKWRGNIHFSANHTPTAEPNINTFDKFLLRRNNQLIAAMAADLADADSEIERLHRLIEQMQRTSR